MLKNSGRKGPSGPAISGQDLKGTHELENCLLSRVGALPIRVSASQHGSYAKKGARMTHERGQPLTANCHGQRNSPRALLN